MPIFKRSIHLQILVFWLLNSLGQTFAIQGEAATDCEMNEVSLVLNLDDYPEETSWIIQDDGGSTVASGGVYNSESPSSTLELSICLEDGEYTFIIYDDYADGICCGYGNGSYSLTDNQENVLASGGEFDDSESTTFTLPYVDEPLQVEVCGNGLDDDGDGYTDCADSDCSSNANCNPDVAIICLEEISEPVICDNCNESSIISLKLQNSGPDPATNTILQYTLPDNLDFDATVSSSGCSESNGVITCNVGGINVGEKTEAIEIGVRPRCGQISEPTDGGELTVDSDELNAGEDFEKKFWFRNGGPNEVNGGSFLDVWPGTYGSNPTPDDNCNDLPDEVETAPNSWEYIGSVTNMDKDFNLDYEDWAMEFTGTILVPEDGDYSVCAEEIDDGSFHAIDLNYDGDFIDEGEILIDQTKWTGSNQQVGISVYLEKGKCYRIISRFKSANGCTYNTGQGLGGFANFGWGPAGSCPASSDFARFVFNPTIQYTSGCLEENDGDGIADVYDLDDDNDGILDVDEMDGGSGSLCYEFYDAVPSGNSVDNIPNTGAMQTGSVTEFNVDNLQEAVDPGDSDQYAIRYMGYMWIETEGSYTFYTSSDDGSKLTIDGTDIVTNDGIHPVEEQSGSATLASGIHSIEVLFFENTGGEELTVQYEGPSISKQNLPFSILYPCSDMDTDGIPNHLDVDSDGDACADAIEGGGTFTSEDLDGENRLNIATLSPPGVDDKGIPNAVGSSGQSVEDSQNNGVMNINCASGGSLPIELRSITVIPQKEGYVLIEWETLTETNNEFFTVERSRNAQDWEIAGKLDGAGTTTEIQKYQFSDNQPFQGTSYYRLKQTDFDGAYTYSFILETFVVPDKDLPARVFPNPTKGPLTLEGNPDEVESITFYDLQGKNVSAQVELIEQSTYQSVWNLFKLPKGVYVLESPNNSFKIRKE
ncbi:MAG: PA14 domain-containing protein [Bacteroidota bacterium]